MNKLSIISKRAQSAKRACQITRKFEYLQKRCFLGDEGTGQKIFRPDRWRIKPFPIAEPYIPNRTTAKGDVVCILFQIKKKLQNIK